MAHGFLLQEVNNRGDSYMGLTKLTTSCIAFLVLTSSAYGGASDGNFWRTLSSDIKGAYLKGYIEAMASCGAFATPKLNAGSEAINAQCGLLVGSKGNKAMALLTKVTPAQLSDALDQFYGDATNRLIAVPRALGVIFMRLTGSSERDIEEMTDFERGLAAGTFKPK